MDSLQDRYLLCNYGFLTRPVFICNYGIVNWCHSIVVVLHYCVALSVLLQLYIIIYSGTALLWSLAGLGKGDLAS